MRTTLIALAVLALSVPVFAQTAPTAPKCVQGFEYWTTVGSPVNGKAMTSHVVDNYASCGDWTPIEVAVTSNGDGSYKEVLVGFGKTILKTARFSWSQSAFAAGGFGSAANGERYIVPATNLKYRADSTYPVNFAFFIYVPLNAAGQTQVILDRLKIERVSGNWKYGVGYSAYWSESHPWENRPYLTVTRITRLGSIELRGEFLDEALSGRGFQIGGRFVH